MQTIRQRLAAIPSVLASRARADFSGLRAALVDRPRLVVIGSGNSAHPAHYLTWLLRRSSRVCGQALTPLEYALLPPREPHVCLLISKGAKRGDSFAVARLSARYHAPLFVLCDETALEMPTVATHLRDEHGPRRVFTFPSGRERGFLSLIGTAAAFAVCHDMAHALGEGLPTWPTLDLEALAREAPTWPPPAQGPCVVLHGPAGRAAAEGFAGYHLESLGPVLTCDMKNFTHGVWRGLREAGRHRVYLVADREVASLGSFLEGKLAADHECVRVSATTAEWSVEPFELFVRMLYHWAGHCQVHAEALAAQGTRGWSPLAMPWGAYSRYRGINEGFDVSELGTEVS